MEPDKERGMLRRGVLAIIGFILAALAVFLFRGAGRLSGFSRLDLLSVAQAQDGYEEPSTAYYEIKMKIVWGKLYNLDLYVAEPDGDIASPINPSTSSGGEIGYYDSEGTWAGGDSGDGVPEWYRVKNGRQGEYVVDVLIPATGGIDDTLQAFILIVLYDKSASVEYLRFPEEGTETLLLDEGGWWNAGSFDFVPIAEIEPEWDIEKTKRCFVAGAAYGSPLADEVEGLSLLRDRYLLTNAAGRVCVGVYYKLGPVFAGIVRENRFLRFLVRASLFPIVKLAGLANP